jgi:CHASE2 domain-containing sensor protein
MGACTCGLKPPFGSADPSTPMGKKARFYSELLRVLPTFVAVVLAASAQVFGLADALDRRIGDALVRISPNAHLDPPNGIPDVAVVTIDARSLRAYDDWPWPRGRHAEAIERLDTAGARAIAFDIDFSSASIPEEDELLAAGLRENGHVVLATFSQFERLGGGAELEIVDRPIEALSGPAAALGSVLVPIDPDGVVRYAPRTSPISDDPIPSLARAALAIATPPDQRAQIRAALEAGDATLIDYRRTDPAIPTLAFVDLMNGRFDPGFFEGRVVFIGATAAEFQDLWATPIAPALPGVMIQALAYRTAAAEIAGGTTLAPTPQAWLLAGYLGLGLLLLPRMGSTRFRRLGRFGCVAGGLVVFTWWGLWEWGFVFPPSVALALVATQYALGVESLQKRILARAAAQESSLSALARLGDAHTDVVGKKRERQSQSTTGLELALELLGEVVSARGVVLMRSTPTGRLTTERLEWRPTDA